MDELIKEFLNKPPKNSMRTNSKEILGEISGSISEEPILGMTEQNPTGISELFLKKPLEEFPDKSLDLFLKDTLVAISEEIPQAYLGKNLCSIPRIIPRRIIGATSNKVSEEMTIRIPD